MMKIIFSIACLILAFCCSSTSTNIGCHFEIQDEQTILGDIYVCDIRTDPNILTKESAQVSEISGIHYDSKSNDDVIGISAYSKTIKFFPKYFENYFKNIKVIAISFSKVKEIHQSDLKVFPDLVYFYFWSNEIEVIEKGLFDFNPKLEVVGFDESKVIHIDPNVFDHLTGLSNLWLEYVPCFGKSIYDSKEYVQQALKVVKSKCSNSDFLSVD